MQKMKLYIKAGLISILRSGSEVLAIAISKLLNAMVAEG